MEEASKKSPRDPAKNDPAARKNRRLVGGAAEDAAVRFMIGRGSEVVSRNWRCRTGEIDLIVREEHTLVFVEVRSRTAPTRYGTALEAVTPRKCRQVRATAEVYLRTVGGSGRPVRFDVIAVTFGNDGSVAELKHIPGAF